MKFIIEDVREKEFDKDAFYKQLGLYLAVIIVGTLIVLMSKGVI